MLGKMIFVALSILMLTDIILLGIIIVNGSA
jgi:hypothetical protein